MLGRSEHRTPVGSKGGSYDNALTETIIGLFKTEVIRRSGLWHNVEDIELATLEGVWWFNCHRLLGSSGHVPPAKFEKPHYHPMEAARCEPSRRNSPRL